MHLLWHNYAQGEFFHLICNSVQVLNFALDLPEFVLKLLTMSLFEDVGLTPQPFVKCCCHLADLTV